MQATVVGLVAGVQSAVPLRVEQAPIPLFAIGSHMQDVGREQLAFGWLQSVFVWSVVPAA